MVEKTAPWHPDSDLGKLVSRIEALEKQMVEHRHGYSDNQLHEPDWTMKLQVAPRDGETLDDVIKHNRELAADL